MQLAMVLSLVALILIAAAATVAMQDRRTEERNARRRRARLARLGEPVPQFASHTELRRSRLRD